MKSVKATEERYKDAYFLPKFTFGSKLNVFVSFVPSVRKFVNIM